MSEISQLIDAVIAPLHTVLKQRGFAKSGRSYHRRERDGVQVINIQASAWNSSESGSFTVNLGLFFPAVAEVLGDPTPTRPSEASCHVRRRIGTLMPTACDHWWEVRPDASPEAVGSELVDVVTTLAVPWLEQCSSLETVLEHCGEPQPAYWFSRVSVVGICVVLGRLQRARALLTELIDGFAAAGNTQQVEKWSVWGREHGVVGA